jgi:hypothetical protein
MAVAPHDFSRPRYFESFRRTFDGFPLHRYFSQCIKKTKYPSHISRRANELKKQNQGTPPDESSVFSEGK